MTNDLQVRFERATVTYVSGRTLDHLQEGLFSTTNTRGIMAAGLASEILLAAGSEIEQELRAQAPLIAGNAYLTGPGRLAQRNLAHIVHGVTIREPGDPPRRTDLERALTVGLLTLEDTGIRSITLPSVTRQLVDRSTLDNARTMTAIIASYLRRRARMNRVVVVSRDDEFLRDSYQSLLDLGGTAD